VCYPEKELIIESAATLEVPEEMARERLQQLVMEQRLEKFDLVVGSEMLPFIWIRSLFMAEISIARDIRRLKTHASPLREIEISKALDWVQQNLCIELAHKQKEAVAGALQEKMMIITGGPGTGKSTITNAILRITQKLTSNILLAAPTGRAAKRMSEITSCKAVTIHSLLEFDFRSGGFKRNRENPLVCDLIIIDEASMIDTMLMYSLLKAMPDHARVVFVGDIHQLPSVGPGNVLNDMIHSRCIHVCMLTEIFRQAAGSRIVVNAHRINEGLFPDVRNLSDSDFYFIEAEDPQQVLNQIVTLVSQRLPKKYGFHPLHDIQVLAPLKKGAIGIQNLNAVLQETLNPQENALFRAGQKFQPGDKVMQLKNDYKREVFNGDIGQIQQIDLVEQHVIVKIDDREVIYDFSDLDELALAYAISVHKYQGSECPCIVMPVHTSHYMLLYKNLLYTGVTRGKKMVVLVGSTKALYLAIKNDEVKQRHTGLLQAIVGMLAPL
jgi:exodeoxyribonuclease V alpha subunit